MKREPMKPNGFVRSAFDMEAFVTYGMHGKNRWQKEPSMHRFFSRSSLLWIGFVIGFIVTGYAFPHYALTKTELTPASTRIVRANGFYSTVSYVRDVAADTESVNASTMFALKSTSVVYSGACKCLTRFTHYDGVTVYTVFVYPEKNEVYYVLGHADSTDGIPQRKGFGIPISKARVEIAEAQALLDSVRARFADQITKS